MFGSEDESRRQKFAADASTALFAGHFHSADVQDRRA
jgi:hypothetical protein